MSPSHDTPTAARLDRTVSRTELWVSLLLLLLCLLALTLAVGAWVWQNLSAQTVLRDHEAQVVMPAELAVQARVEDKVDVRLDHTLTVSVPFRDRLSIRIADPLSVQARLQTQVPLDILVPVDQALELDQVIDIDTRVRTRVLGLPVTVPIQGQVPLKASIPIRVDIPIKQSIPVSLDVPVTVHLLEPLIAHADTQFKVRVPLRADLRVPVTQPVQAVLSFPQAHIPIGIERLDVDMPLRDLHLTMRKPPQHAPGGRP